MNFIEWMCVDTQIKGHALLKQTLLTAFLGLYGSIACAGDGFGIANLEPGAEMKLCPIGFDHETSRTAVQDSFTCLSQRPTLGRPVKSISAQVFDSRVVAVVVFGFESRSHWAKVVDELAIAYGQPNVTKDGYTWRRGDFYFMRAETADGEMRIVSGHLPSLQRMAAARKALSERLQ